MSVGRRSATQTTCRRVPTRSFQHNICSKTYLHPSVIRKQQQLNHRDGSSKVFSAAKLEACMQLPGSSDGRPMTALNVISAALSFSELRASLPSVGASETVPTIRATVRQTKVANSAATWNTLLLTTWHMYMHQFAV